MHEPASAVLIHAPEPPLLAAVARLEGELLEAADPQDVLAPLTRALNGRLPGCAVGILLARDGELHVAAASSGSLPALISIDAARLDGPAHTAHRTGRPVLAPHGIAAEYRTFGVAAAEAGFASAYGLPIEADGRRWGALLVLARHPTALDAGDLAALHRLARSVADALQAHHDRQADAVPPRAHQDDLR